MIDVDLPRELTVKSLFMTEQVFERLGDDCRVVTELPKPKIACFAKKAPDFAGGVIMVDTKPLLAGSSFRAFAYGAGVVLLLSHALIVSHRNAVFQPDLGFSVLLARLLVITLAVFSVVGGSTLTELGIVGVLLAHFGVVFGVTFRTIHGSQAGSADVAASRGRVFAWGKLGEREVGKACRAAFHIHRTTIA